MIYTIILLLLGLGVYIYCATLSLLTKISEDLEEIKKVLCDKQSVTITGTTSSSNIVDFTNQKPFIPEDWKIEEHKELGKVDLSKMELYLLDKQKTGYIVGNELRKTLQDKNVLNACVLDYLLAHPEIIPEEWKGQFVYFWGTIYRSADGHLCVRVLCWHGGRWDWFDCFWLCRGWRGFDPAAVSAST